MNDDNRQELLKELRRRATSSWAVSAWKLALETLGFTVSLEKDGRKIVGFRAVDASGKSVYVQKDPRHRALFLDGRLDREWEKQGGVPLSDLASKALGLETLAAEKARPPAGLDLTNTGTCSVCRRLQKLNDGRLVRHGYVRPGDGWIRGDCPGVHFLPWEQSPEGAVAYLRSLKSVLKADEERLEAMRSGVITSLFVRRGYAANAQEVEVRAGEPEFGPALRAQITSLEYRVRSLVVSIKLLETDIETWQPSPLPEEKFRALTAGVV